MWRQTVIRMINIDLFNYNKTAAENVEDPRLLNSLL